MAQRNLFLLPGVPEEWISVGSVSFARAQPARQSEATSVKSFWELRFPLQLPDSRLSGSEAMNENGKKWPAVPQVPLIGSDGVRAAADEIVGSRRSYRRPQPPKEFVVGCAAVIETSTGPGRPVPTDADWRG